MKAKIRVEQESVNVWVVRVNGQVCAIAKTKYTADAYTKAIQAVLDVLGIEWEIA